MKETFLDTYTLKAYLNKNIYWLRSTMEIHKILEHAYQENECFVNHPLSTKNKEEQTAYLLALSILMSSDGNIHSEEANYLCILINSFDFPKSSLESLITFAKKPDIERLHHILEQLSHLDFKATFLLDCYMLAYRDGTFQVEEQELLGRYIANLDIDPLIAGSIQQLQEYILSENIEGLQYFRETNAFIPLQNYQYLLNYYSINIDQKVDKHEDHIDFLSDMIRIPNDPENDIEETILSQPEDCFQVSSREFQECLVLIKATHITLIQKANARQCKHAFQILNVTGKLWGFYDPTVFSSLKEGIAFTDHGIYWQIGDEKGFLEFEAIINYIFSTSVEELVFTQNSHSVVLAIHNKVALEELKHLMIKMKELIINKIKLSSL
ncbi:MAG: putative tellurite resistance protein B-like protein [bacterium]|jgi:uncharacterized tellurite resistance protein B-like protein